jgi:2-iminobutanoate/2-iminopropanoate deaminase
MKFIATSKAPHPLGHYSQAVVHGGMIYVSGQLAIDPRTRLKHGETIEQQAEQALMNVSAILVAAGSDINHVLRTTVYITDVSLWPKVNTVYGHFFGEHRPARAIVPVKELPGGYLVQIDAIAAVGADEA